MKTIVNFPCQECDCTLLNALPESDFKIAECIECGHPNNSPGYEAQNKYYEYLNSESDPKGYVVFFDFERILDGLTEIGRTGVMDSFSALTVYANTHNPASQLITFYTEKEREVKEAALQENLKSPEWLAMLAETI